MIKSPNRMFSFVLIGFHTKKKYTPSIKHRNMLKPHSAIFSSISSVTSLRSGTEAFYKYSCALHKIYIYIQIWHPFSSLVLKDLSFTPFSELFIAFLYNEKFKKIAGTSPGPFPFWPYLWCSSSTIFRALNN